jgi:uncharacterized Rmd1/YagE family protein
MRTKGQRKSLRDEGDENNTQFSNTVIQRGVVISWCLTKGQEEKCLSSIGRAEKEPKKQGDS